MENYKLRFQFLGKLPKAPNLVRVPLLVHYRAADIVAVGLLELLADKRHAQMLPLLVDLFIDFD